MSATNAENEAHLRAYQRFLTRLRWVVMWIAASLATIVVIFARGGIIPALIVGSVMFAIVAVVTKRIFLNPHEHAFEDAVERPKT